LRNALCKINVLFTYFLTPYCCKGDSSFRWNTRYLKPNGSKTNEPIDIKLVRGDYVGDLTPHANFGISTLKQAEPLTREIVIIRLYFTPPPLFFYYLAHLHRSYRLTHFRG